MNNKDMKFKKGNKFWENRLSIGRKLIFKDDETLWNACVEYFEWNEANPPLEQKICFFQGKSHHGTVKKMGALTMDGLCVFLMISKQTWYDYKKRADFIDITTRVEQLIRDQKFRGAAADLLNPNIIARDLGLSDKQEIEQKTTVGGIIEVPAVASIEQWELMGIQSQERIKKAHEKLDKDFGS